MAEKIFNVKNMHVKIAFYWYHVKIKKIGEHVFF